MKIHNYLQMIQQQTLPSKMIVWKIWSLFTYFDFSKPLKTRFCSKFLSKFNIRIIENNSFAKKLENEAHANSVKELQNTVVNAGLNTLCKKGGLLNFLVYYSFKVWCPLEGHSYFTYLQLLATDLFKYTWPFSGYQAIKG